MGISGKSLKSEQAKSSSFSAAWNVDAMAGALVATLTCNVIKMMEQIKPQVSCFCDFPVGGVSVLGGLVGSIWVVSSHIHTGICDISVPI